MTDCPNCFGEWQKNPKHLASHHWQAQPSLGRSSVYCFFFFICCLLKNYLTLEIIIKQPAYWYFQNILFVSMKVLFCFVMFHFTLPTFALSPLPVFVFVLQAVPSFASVLPLSVHATLCIFLSASFHTFLDFSWCHLDLFVCWMSLTFAILFTDLQLSVYFYIIILSWNPCKI